MGAVFTRFMARGGGSGGRKPAAFGALAIALVAALAWLAASLYRAPGAFPANSVFTVREGSTIASLAGELEAGGYVGSSFVFEKLVVLLGKERGVIAGDYYFPKPLNVLALTRRIANGSFGMTPVKVTVPEGYTLAEIAALFEGRFYKFKSARFMEVAKGKEGYLFPDTYFFMPNIVEEDVVELLSDNFDDKVRDIETEIGAAGKTLGEIVTLASIIEKEVHTPADRRLISGILWNRLKIGMPLQVDATLGYVTNKGTFQLTKSDLDMDSPYNTYKYKGLPPTPIANPGLDSILAALRPEASKYLYYLSDKSGKVYYANTFEEHKRNRELYLNK